MAEAIAIIGLLSSVGSLVEQSSKLYKQIDTIAEGIKNADNQSKKVAHSVRSTCQILKQLQRNLESEKEVKACNDEFYADVELRVGECKQVFKELDSALRKAVPELPQDLTDLEAFLIRRRDQVTWPFRQPKLVAITIEIDRLKADLNTQIVLMIHTQTTQARRDEELRRAAETVFARR